MITRSLRFADLLKATTQTKYKLLGTTLIAVLIASGCSSEQSASTTVAPTVREESTTSAAPPATEATTTPTAPPISETTTTVAPSTTAAPEPTVPTTTADVDAAATEAALAGALAAHTAGWLDCVAAVPQCDAQTLAATRDGGQLQTSTDIIQGANTNGWSISNLDSYRTEMVALRLVDGQTAEITACNEDGLLVADRSGEIVSDRFSSNLTVWTFELIDGAWKATTGLETNRAIGQESSLCDF